MDTRISCLLTIARGAARGAGATVTLLVAAVTLVAAVARLEALLLADTDIREETRKHEKNGPYTTIQHSQQNATHT
jgi:hypothetical protein